MLFLGYRTQAIQGAARTLSALALALSALSVTTQSEASPETYRIYIDADFTTTHEIGNAIALGIKTALSEVDFSVAGANIQIVDKNHKGSTDRSFRTMQNMLVDSAALALFGGMHSPPYLEHKDFINRSQLLTLLPWSAAGPITRASPNTENWIFRLSVDDAKAGRFLVKHTINQDCKRTALLLVDTGWGRTNKATMLSALRTYGVSPAYVQMVPRRISKAAARKIADDVKAAHADCAIMLALATDAALISKAFFALDHPIAISSHWSILGTDYTATVPHNVRQFINLQILQSCGLRVENDGTPYVANALQGIGADIETLADISAPAGFVHGYDLTRIFIAAMQQAARTPDWDGDITQKRKALKAAMEALEMPVQGILKEYLRPFSPYTTSTPDAHEALGAEDLCMAEYNSEGRLRHIAEP